MNKYPKLAIGDTAEFDGAKFKRISRVRYMALSGPFYGNTYSKPYLVARAERLAKLAPHEKWGDYNAPSGLPTSTAPTMSREEYEASIKPPPRSLLAVDADESDALEWLGLMANYYARAKRNRRNDPSHFKRCVAALSRAASAYEKATNL